MKKVLEGVLLIALLISAMFAIFPIVKAADSTPGTVTFIGKDTETKGDWQNAKQSPLGTYGSCAHILPNAPIKEQVPVGVPYTVPVGDKPRPVPLPPPLYWTTSQWTGLHYYSDYGGPDGPYKKDPPYWDEFVIEPKMPSGFSYFLTGTLYIEDTTTIGDGDSFEIGSASVTVDEYQFPVFEWVWDDWNMPTPADPRAAHYKVIGPSPPDTLLACWDDGGERGWPSNGYFDVTLTFPSGKYMLSLYAYDKERTSRTNETIYMMDESGAILDSRVIGGTEFDEGIYLQYWVYGPTKIVVRVEKAPDSINAVLSGIFVDCLLPVGGYTVFSFPPIVGWMLISLAAVGVASAAIIFIRRHNP